MNKLQALDNHCPLYRRYVRVVTAQAVDAGGQDGAKKVDIVKMLLEEELKDVEE